MLKLKLGPDREPHCSRPGCDERIGRIRRIWAYQSDTEGIPGTDGYEAGMPSWTDADFGQGSTGMQWRAFVVEPGWRRDGEVWRKIAHKRSQRPRVTPMTPGMESYVAPFVAPPMPTTVECPRCRARLTANPDDIEVESRIDDDLDVGSGHEGDARFFPRTTPRMDEEATAQAELYIEGLVEAGVDSLDARIEYLVEKENYSRDRATREVYEANDSLAPWHESREQDT